MGNKEDEDDDLLTIRDKFAIEILNGLLQRESITLGGPISGFVGMYLDNHNSDFVNQRIQEMKAIIRAAYKMADIMREVRLATFE